eukprot:TRINITY_DN97235_c0_g1_i1.p1 TRINITY_DN97235_c0_g1~~TRINITY_DN97235_c0_g1_i1.p1  ORF type:complete len:525 (+),score=120.89 TRINITY_DN97235_c0_g1_i1:79-1653(+)
MAMSDGSMRSLELWNDGPAVQATLAQMQFFQTQMQQQLQDQLAQIRLQMSSLQTPQPSYGLQVPAWPSQILPQMPCSSQAPMPKKAKVRAGRLGKRERAELKAARFTQKSECSEAESGERLHAGVEKEQNWTREAQGDADTMQRLTEAFGKIVKTEMDGNMKELRDTCEKMLSEAVEQVAAVIHESQTATKDVVACLKTDLKADFSDTCKSLVEEALASAHSKMESEQASQKAALQLQVQALESKLDQHEDRLKGQVQDEMHSFGNEVKALELSVHNLRSELPSLQAQSAELSGHCQHLVEEVSSKMLELQQCTNEARGTLRMPNDFQANRALQRQDCSVQCDGTASQAMAEVQTLEPSPDCFSSSLGLSITDSNSLATCDGSHGVWRTVFGNRDVAQGKYQWQLRVERSPLVRWSVVVGVAYADLRKQSSATHVFEGFGYDVSTVEKKSSFHPQRCSNSVHAAEGDVVAVVLDMVKRQLSFKKNSQDMGVSHDVPPGTYCLAINMLAGGAVRLLSSAYLASSS